MADETNIGWCDHTLNWWHGCAEVASGCENCYARELTKRFTKQVVWGAKAPRLIVKGAPASVQRWQTAAAKEGGKKRVFCGSMMDIFERPRPLVDRDGKMIMNVMTGDLRRSFFNMITDGAWPNLEFQLLTKRPANINKCIPESWMSGRAPDNVLFGTSVSEQTDVDIYVGKLVECTPRDSRRFLSVEPMIRRVDIRRYLAYIDWVIIGGESGPKARPMHPWWATELAEQCHDAGIPVFMKQQGAWSVVDREGDTEVNDIALHFGGSSVNYLGWADMIVKDSHGMWKRMRKGNTHGTELNDIPEGWRVQEFP